MGGESKSTPLFLRGIGTIGEWSCLHPLLQLHYPKQYRIPRMIPLVSSSLRLRSPLRVYLPSFLPPLSVARLD